MSDSPSGAPRRFDLLTRLQPAYPLLVVYVLLATLYTWQASLRAVPTIFSDELELGQLSRAIAETGQAARRGEPYGLPSLVAYFLAPVWWLGSTSAAYTAAKLLLVLSMTAVVFPAYGLARLVVPHWYAVAAATGATAVPAFAYSPIIVEEPLAYPLSTLALWLIARALVRPRFGGVALAVAVSGVAALTRTQLSILLAVLVLGLLWIGWQSDLVRAWRATWSTWDWVGAVTLAIGALVVFSAFAGQHSTSWRETTSAYKDRLFEHATWATGALAIGVGVLPLVIGVAALARPRSEPSDPRTRAFVTTSVATLGVFVWYAGIKGAFLSTRFSTLIVERNLIYLYPVLFAATALAFHRGIGRAWAIAGAAVVTLYVVTATPAQLEFPYYEAHGLAILAFANRELGWPQERIETALVLVCLLSIAVVVALRLVRSGSRAFGAIAACCAVAILAWSLTTEVYAARGERSLSDQVDLNLPRPYDWVDRATGGDPVVVIGQHMGDDPTGLWLTEFFNRSVRKVWSLDGTAPGPGPTLTPDLGSTDGTLTPSPETAYVLALGDVELAAPVVASRGRERLYRIDGGPVKLRAGLTGAYADGWMPGEAAYTRYDVSGDGPSLVRVLLSRVAWCGGDVPGRATVEIGPVTIGPDKQPAIAEVTDRQTDWVHHCRATGFTVRAPLVPWRLEITIDPTFVPNELDPTSSDRRELGAVLGIDVRSLFEDD